MSFLRRGRLQRKKSIRNKHNPSPTNQRLFRDRAHSPAKKYSGGASRRSIRCRSAERISLPASLKRSVSASMTVEAAVVLPLFLFFLINLSCAIELIRLHGNLQMALWDTGSRLAVYGHAIGDKDTAPLFTWFFIKNQMTEYAGEEYLDRSPLSSGPESLMLWESNIFSSQDELDIVVTYSVSPWSGPAGFSPFRMANRYYAHIWNGYDVSGADREAREETDIVYMTENGKVYHEDRSCSHLVLDIRQVSRTEAEIQTNAQGEKFTPCEKCRPAAADKTLYITADGDRYHSDRACPGLKRTVFSVPRSRAAGLPACSRCG